MNQQGAHIMTTYSRRDFLLLLLSVAAWFVAITNIDGSRLGWGADEYPPLKFLPAIITVICLPFLIKHFSAPFALALFLPLPLIFGGLFSMLAYGFSISNTYTGRGISFLFFILGTLFATQGYTAHQIIQTLRKPLIFAGCCILIGVFLYPFGIYPFGINAYGRIEQLYHAEIYLLSALPFLFAGRISTKIFILFSFLTFFILALNGKTTSYLVSLSGLALAFYFALYKRNSKVDSYGRFVRLFLGGFAALAVGGMIVNIFSDKVDSSEETTVRIISLTRRMEEFWSSPFFGSLFSGDPLIEFTSHLVIPSHLDFLDLLSQGGIFWFALFVYIVYKALRNSFRLGRQNIKYTVFSAMIVSALFVMLVNPIIGLPRLSFFFLFAIGYMYAYKFK